jgi:signal transduction histidine kinase
LPAWHQTTWFRGLVVLAIVGGAVGFYRRRISRLEAQRAAQQNFSRRLIESQEQERKRIAAELHDSLGQHLLVIKNRAAMGLNATADTAPEQLDEITRAATQALEEVREISQNLRPYQLDRLGLTRALHGLVKKVSASSNLKCTADIAPLDGVFRPEAEINLYRIVQEGLNNILKHSGATEARVVVERDETRVRLQIEDNGHGFDPSTAHANPDRAGGMGLSGIAERIRILGGRLDIQSSPGAGTQLKIELPLPTTEKKS